MQCFAHEPLYDVDPRTGASIEVFYADRALETFGRCGAGLVLVAPASAAFRRMGRRRVRLLRATQRIGTR